MNIKITIKQLGKKRSKFTEVDFRLENKPSTVHELIKEAVCTCVREYNRNVANNVPTKALSEEEIENMSEIGKIAFGINYGEKTAAEKDAVEVAIQAFKDGLVRIFKDEEELANLDEIIDVKEADKFTFVRLAFLAGRMF